MTCVADLLKSFCCGTLLNRTGIETKSDGVDKMSSTKSHSQQQTNEDISSQTDDESRCSRTINIMKNDVLYVRLCHFNTPYSAA